MVYSQLIGSQVLLLKGISSALMKKKRLIHSGDLPTMPSERIFLNVNYLKNGVYTLNIMHQNKVIKQITFKK